MDIDWLEVIKGTLANFVAWAQAVEPRNWLYLVGAIAVYAVYHLLKRQLRPKTITAFEGKSGTVVVTEAAMDDLIRKTCKSIESISGISAHMHEKKNKLFITVNFKMHASYRLSDVNDVLAEKLEAAIRQTINYEKEIVINPRLKGFVSSQSNTLSHAASEETAYATLEESGDYSEPEKAGFGTDVVEKEDELSFDEDAEPAESKNA